MDIVAAASQNHRMKNASVLIADDDRDFAESLGLAIEVKGHRPQLAFGGRQALEEYAKNGFDLCLLDIKMPDMTGVAAFKAIRDIDPRASVVLMTGYAMSEIAEISDRDDIRVIHKPVNMDSLMQLIDQTVGRS